jgi:hypothetical protein
LEFLNTFAYSGLGKEFLEAMGKEKGIAKDKWSTCATLKQVKQSCFHYGFGFGNGCVELKICEILRHN